jgi:hypothetical protein
LVAKDLASCGTRKRQSRRAPVRIHEPQPLTRIAVFNVDIDGAFALIEIHHCVGKLLRKKKKPRSVTPTRALY